MPTPTAQSFFKRSLFVLLAAAIAVTVWPHDVDGQTIRPLNEREQVIHVLNRLAFGPAPGQIETVMKTGWRRWLEEQLEPDLIDDSALEQRLRDEFPALFMSMAQARTQYTPERRAATPEERRAIATERNQLRNQIQAQLAESVIIRAVYSNRQLEEVLVEFWRNHLNVDINKVYLQSPDYEQNVLRKHAFGRFEDMILASAKHPAMLIYLDNHVSRRGALNENYARELMELHTLGVDNFYEQKDVTELARVLTGWTIGQSNGEYGFSFQDRNHDSDPATVVGYRLDGSGGLADGEAVIRYLCNHEGTARFISRKLCVYLVNDNPPAELVEEAAQVFLSTGGDLKEVYRAIVLSPHFMNSAHYRAKFKTPFEYVISALRTTGARIDNARQLRRDLRFMGQKVYECEDPTGYYDKTESWLDPGVMVYRWNFAIQLVTDKVAGVRIAAEMFDPWQRLPQTTRGRNVIDTILDGRTDPRTEQNVMRIVDVRGAIAMALGSPTFQQQ